MEPDEASDIEESKRRLRQEQERRAAEAQNRRRWNRVATLADACAMQDEYGAPERLPGREAEWRSYVHSWVGERWRDLILGILKECQADGIDVEMLLVEARSRVPRADAEGAELVIARLKRACASSDPVDELEKIGLELAHGLSSEPALIRQMHEYFRGLECEIRVIVERVCGSRGVNTRADCAEEGLAFVTQKRVAEVMDHSSTTLRYWQNAGKWPRSKKRRVRLDVGQSSGVRIVAGWDLETIMARLSAEQIRLLENDPGHLGTAPSDS